MAQGEIESASFFSVKHPSCSLTSLLNVPFVRFPSVLFSPTAPSSKPSASTTSIARSRRISPSAPARWSESGQMDDSAPDTGYEPKLDNFFSCLDPEPTPINIPDSHHNFLCSDDATMIPTSPEGLPNSGASSGSKQTTGSRVPLMFGPSSLWKQGACHVSGRSGLQETGAELDRESVAATLLQFPFFERERRSRHKRCAFVERQRKSPKDPWTES